MTDKIRMLTRDELVEEYSKLVHKHRKQLQTEKLVAKYMAWLIYGAVVIYLLYLALTV